MGLPIIGVVENMSGFVCPNCKVRVQGVDACVQCGWWVLLLMLLTSLQNETAIFAATNGGAAKMAQDMGVPFLGSLPIDPQIGRGQRWRLQRRLAMWQG